MKKEELKNQEYKYGFTTDIENIKAPNTSKEGNSDIEKQCRRDMMILYQTRCVSKKKRIEL